MRVVTPAPLLQAKPVSVEFVASVLRNVQRAEESEIEKISRKSRDAGYEAGGKHYREQYAALKKSVDEFEAASGVGIRYYSDGKDLGEAVNTLRNLKYRVEHISEAIKACDGIRGMLAQVQHLATLHEEVSNE